MTTPDPSIFEKLGDFYLGREVDPTDPKALGAPLLYDSKDLVTHGVVLGMTGSGKTGLCIAALEEAAIDGIPALIIDPKGDIANLMLTFPNLSAEEFQPWINPDEARREEVSESDYARQQADLWKNGLAEWGQDAARIQRLRAAADVRIYTPGSSAGLPLSLLGSFTPPPPEILEDTEALGDQIETTVSSLLALAGIEGDPVQSREHILLSNIFLTNWQAGRSLDLGTLIGQIQKPPFARLGVLELEALYPEKDRFGLALAFNNLLASPGFANWLQGQPLDIARLLMNDAGKPQVSIFSIAHLSNTERMFFVSLLLNRVVSWMRSQPGTTSLRALLYMDEVFGFLPPTAMPPSKKPLLTLLKQARAFGLGVLLASQNPVDLDYKALSNMGTWFLGRLQTARDQERVLAGLESASSEGGGTMNKAELQQLLAGLGKRVFLMRNVHESRPVTFQTRWVMSYLRGPLTRNQIKTLMDPFREELPASSTDGTAPAAAQTAAAKPTASQWLLEPPDPGVSVDKLFAPLLAGAEPHGFVWKPTAFLEAEVRFDDRKAGVQSDLTIRRVIPVEEVGASREFGEDLPENDFAELTRTPPAGARFAPLPEALRDSPPFTRLKDEFEDHLYRRQRLRVLYCPLLEAYSQPGESDPEFRLRISTQMREKRDAAVEELRARYRKKLEDLEDDIATAEDRLAREKEQAGSATVDGVMRFGTALLGTFLGRRKFGVTSMSRGTTAARGASRAWKEHQDVGRAEDKVRELQAAHEDLETEFTRELDALGDQFQPANLPVEPYEVSPYKKDIHIHQCGVLWRPEAIAE